MLVRVLLICGCAVSFLSGCGPAMELKLVGSWRAKSPDDTGQIEFRADHTFASRESAVTYSHQPAVLSDEGDWHLNGDKLVLNFHGDSHPAGARQVEFVIRMPNHDHFTIRQANALETILERVK